jgi:hypothetical protein
MPQEPQGYLLQIRDGGRVVAEAPLIVHDPEAAWRLFEEGFGMMAHMVVGSLYNTVRVACDEDLLGKAGPQVALKLEAPSALVTPQANGNMP